MENKQNIFENNSKKINYVELDMENWSFSKSFITAPSFNANNAFVDTMDNGEKQAHVVNSLADRIGITKLTFDSEWGNASTAVNMLTSVLYGSMRSDENLIQYGAWRTSNTADSLFSYFKRPSIEIKNNEGELVERKLYTEIEQGFIGNMMATDNGYIAFGGLMDSLTFTTFENYRPMVVLLDADFEHLNHVEYTNTSISATNFNDLNASYQLEVLPNGNYLIYSHTEMRIIDASGNEVVKEELPEQSFLQGLVVVEDGNFIISAEDQLRKYDVNGTLLKTLDLDIRLTPDLVANEGLVYFASGFDTSFETEAGNFSTIHTFIGAVNTNLEVVNLNE